MRSDSNHIVQNTHVNSLRTRAFGGRCALGFQKQAGNERLFDAVSADGTGGVSLEEFRALMKGELLLADPLEEIRAVFAVLCSAGGGGGGGSGGFGGAGVTLAKLRITAGRFQVV